MSARNPRPDTEVVSTRLTLDLIDRIDRLSWRTGHSRAWFVRQAVLAHIDALEAAYEPSRGCSHRVDELTHDL